MGNIHKISKRGVIMGFGTGFGNQGSELLFFFLLLVILYCGFCGTGFGFGVTE